MMLPWTILIIIGTLWIKRSAERERNNTISPIAPPLVIPLPPLLAPIQTIDLPAEKLSEPLTPELPKTEEPIASKINLEDFIRDKLEPPVNPTDFDKVRETTLEFDQEKTEDGITVCAFLLLSPEDVAIIEDKGLNDEMIEEEAAFDDERFELLETAQAKEIAEAPNPRARAILRALHKQQIQDAKAWKLKLTIANYRAMERHFKSALEATKWQTQIEQRVMQRVNQLLGHFREKATRSVR